MRQLSLRPALYRYEDSKDFVAEFALGPGDLILTNKLIYAPYLGALDIEADVIFQENYGTGEATEAMAAAIRADIKGPHRRIVGIGGGTVLDLAKLFSLKDGGPVADAFASPGGVVRDKGLVLAPTTCGTGSEVTSVAVLETGDGEGKTCFEADALFADAAVLIPQLLESLPYPVFAAGSLDAFIHAVEAAVSPRANSYSNLFAYKALDLIVSGYRVIADNFEIARIPLLGDFLTAANYAGIAFASAGLGAVHALGAPLWDRGLTTHGEANYVLFSRVYRQFGDGGGDGALAALNRRLAAALGCDPKDVHDSLDTLLGKIRPRRRLRDFGVSKRDLAAFAGEAAGRRRFMDNAYMPLSEGEILSIYKDLF